MSYARSIAQFEPALPLFQEQENEKMMEAMSNAIREVESAARVLEKPTIWSDDAKASDDVLVPILREFHRRIDRYNDMPKANLHRLVEHIPDEELNPEIIEKLDAIADAAEFVASVVT